MAAAEEQRVADVGAGGTNSGIDHASGRFRSSLNHCIVRIPDITMGKHVLIISGGIAELAAGCYARMNGFKETGIGAGNFINPSGHQLIILYLTLRTWEFHQRILKLEKPSLCCWSRKKVEMVALIHQGL